MANLFDSLEIRSVTLRNRIAVSPMCQYSSVDGKATDWHMVHLGSRAVGGAGLVICEATAVQDIGRISPGDAGIWSDAHIEPLLKMNRFIHSQGAVAGIQLAHAGRKASTKRPWEKGPDTTPVSEGGWENVISPSAVPFSETYPKPREMTVQEIKKVILDFQEAAKRALKAEYRWVEIHAAHGYLAHTFLSPLSNHRTDAYGGSFENRIRFVLELTKAVREAWPDHLPLAVRISATDWAEGGWNIDESVELSKRLKLLGVDLVDCSSGGMVPDAKIPVGPNYQVPFAERIKKEADILTGAVGMITESHQADAIIWDGKADLVLLARELLRNPYWPIHAAAELAELERAKNFIPVQYGRAFS